MFQPRYILLGSWQRRLLVAAAALLACIVATPQQAQASCGDYVLMGGAGQGGHGDSSLLSTNQRGTERGFPVCRGPGCRQRQDVPSSPPTRITLDEHSWGWLPRLDRPNSETWAVFAPSHQPVCALFLAAGIFRPPRPAADA